MFREWARRFGFLFHRRERIEDLEAEMRLHRELRAAQLRREGIATGEAECAAARRLGNTTLIKEACQDMWGWIWLDDAIKDLRFTARTLRHNALFTAVAVLTLALGIGANTAIFSVINAVLLRTLPVQDPKQLYFLHVLPGQPDGAHGTGNPTSSFSEYAFEQLRTEHQAFSSLAAYVPAGFNKIAVRTGGTPEEAAVDMVSGNFFSALGVHALCGRTIAMRDEQDHTAVAVLSYRYWNRRFAGNCSAIGQPVYIKGIPFTIVGVAAKNFEGVESVPIDLWIPLQNQPAFNAWGSAGPNYYSSPNWWCLLLVGRLAPGIKPEKAQAMLEPAFQRAAYEHLAGHPREGEQQRKLQLIPVRGIAGHDEAEKPLLVLLAMVGLILLIACGNVAMLLTARNAARGREFSVRLAIGGSQMRLFRQLLAESLVLVVAGAVLGWIFALFATRALAAWGQIEFSLAPDARVLLFTGAISCLAALIFGLAPLLTTLRVPVNLALKTSSATAFENKSKSRRARIVLALQISLCLILTVGAGLLVQTLRNLEHENLGFNTKNLLVFGLNPQVITHSTPKAIRFYQNLLAKLRALPGVESATVMENRLGSGWSNNTDALVDGRDPRASSGASSNMMRWNAIAPDYFGTLGVPIRVGREFTDADSTSAPKVAIVNETFARRFLPGRQPLGHQVSFTRKLAFTIVGVAANSKYTGINEKNIPMAYFPYTQMTEMGAMHVEIRVSGNPTGFWNEIRKAVASFSPDLALLQPMTQRAQFDEGISQQRLVARLSIFFGALAVLLVATGLYGTLAYRVNRRTSELGIRMAVGAQRSELLWMILRESLIICAIGIAIGLPLAIVCARALASLLYGLAPYDPLIVGLACAGIAAISVAAAFLPARRAASVDPLVALRYE